MKDRNYFYERLEQGQFDLSDDEIEKYVDEHFDELIDKLIRTIAKVLLKGGVK